MVLIRTANTLRGARGSGFTIGDGSWVVTASHVVSADLGKGKRISDKTVFVYHPWTGRPYEAKVVAVDGVADIALLRLPEAGLPALPVEGLDLKDATAAANALKDRPIRLYGFPLSYGEDTVAALAKPEFNDSQLKEIAKRGETNLCVLNACKDAQPGWSGGPMVGMDKKTIVGVFHSLYRPKPDADPGFPAGSLAGYLGDLLKQAGATDMGLFASGAAPKFPRPANARDRMAREMRSLSWAATGNFTRAVEEQQEMVKLAPEDGLARVELGRALLDAKQYEAAEATLREAVRLAPKSMTAHLLLGRALHMDYDPKGAVSEIQAAMEASPGEVEPQLALAQVYEDNQKLEQAEAVLRKAQEGAPEHPGVLYRLGELLLKEKKDADGLKALEQAATLSSADPGLAFVLLGYARALEDTGKGKKDSESLYRQAIKLDPRNPQGYYLFSMYYLRRNRVEDAQIYLNSGIALPGLSESMVEAFRNLQDLLNQRGVPDKDKN